MSSLNIKSTHSRGNRHRHAAFGLATCLLVVLTACASPRRANEITWQLASAVDIESIPQWRLRIADAAVLPDGVVQPLCDEFDLLHVYTAPQWRRLCATLGLSAATGKLPLDFQHGSVVGLVARIGEPAEDDWPISLTEARVQDGLGWLRFRFETGIYFPVQTGPYVLLCYVPQLRQPVMIEINGRIFALGDQ